MRSLRAIQWRRLVLGELCLPQCSISRIVSREGINTIGTPWLLVTTFLSLLLILVAAERIRGKGQAPPMPAWFGRITKSMSPGGLRLLLVFSCFVVVAAALFAVALWGEVAISIGLLIVGLSLIAFVREPS